MAKRIVFSQAFKDKYVKLIAEKKMTQGAAAKEAGVSTVTLRRWIAASTKPKASPKKTPKAKAVKKTTLKTTLGGTVGIDIRNKIEQREKEIAVLNEALAILTD